MDLVYQDCFAKQDGILYTKSKRFVSLWVEALDKFERHLYVIKDVEAMIQAFYDIH